MGFFSWITSDTNKSIANNCSARTVFTVHMITEDGQVFTEDDYEGYGEFGGKDIYELIAEINGLKSREAAVELVYKTIITNGRRSYTAGGVDFFNWETPLPQEGGKTPNQLVESKEFRVEHPLGYGDWNKASTMGFKFPKLVEKLPSKKNWEKVWNSLPYPETCPDQGYFYDDGSEEEE